MFTLKGGGGSRPRDRRRQSGAEHYLFMYLYIYLCIRTNFEVKKEKEVRRDSTLPPLSTKLLPNSYQYFSAA